MIFTEDAKKHEARLALLKAAKDLLIGCKVGELPSLIKNHEKSADLLDSTNHKGNIGNLVELALGLDTNSRQKPDFEHIGVEVKATPVEKASSGTWRAGERLVITNISYRPEDNQVEGRERSFEESHLASKLDCILLCVYLRPAKHTKEDRTEYEFNQVVLFSPPTEDMAIIRNDWEQIMSFVRNGRAEELSESMTKYLGACTKGSNSSVRKKQGYHPFTDAKPRAFCLKSSYMTQLFNSYIMEEKGSEWQLPESLGGDFETTAMERLAGYGGKMDAEICKMLGLEEKMMRAKNAHSIISLRMMGIKSNACEEFLKANIVMKTLRFEPSGRLKESISLPVSDFLAVYNEESFYDSSLDDYFESTRFLLSIWKKEDGGCRFIGAAFWAMPMSDIEGPLKNCWDDVKQKLEHGVRFEIVQTEKGSVIKNDLPKKSAPGSIAHVRPHSSLSYHEIDGVIYASGKASRSDAFELNDGNWMTKQSFWLNNSYMEDVVHNLGFRL